MRTRRFNWIVTLVAGLVAIAIGVSGLLRGAGSETFVWFMMGFGSIGISVWLYRMHLP